jgi:hypothetical protein
MTNDTIRDQKLGVRAVGTQQTTAPQGPQQSRRLILQTTLFLLLIINRDFHEIFKKISQKIGKLTEN